MNDKLDTKDKSMYIYDVNKARFYNSKGIKPEDFGINKNTNKIWFLFGKKETEKAYKEWRKRCKAYKKSHVNK